VTNLPKLRPELLFSLHAFEQDLLQSNSQVNLSRALSSAYAFQINPQSLLTLLDFLPRADGLQRTETALRER
jgi:hypothetical protein